jgi:hypothetical protein
MDRLCPNRMDAKQLTPGVPLAIPLVSFIDVGRVVYGRGRRPDSDSPSRKAGYRRLCVGRDSNFSEDVEFTWVVVRSTHNLSSSICRINTGLADRQTTKVSDSSTGAFFTCLMIQI